VIRPAASALASANVMSPSGSDWGQPHRMAERIQMAKQLAEEYA